MHGKNRNREQMGEKKGMEVVSKKGGKTSSPLFILVCHFQVVKEGKQQPTGRNKIERIIAKKKSLLKKVPHIANLHKRRFDHGTYHNV